MTDACPTCGKPHDTPDRASNSSHSMISVPDYLLPALADAIAIGRNTAMMSGGTETKDQLEDLRLEVSARIPAAAKLFTRYQWVSIFTRAAQGADLTVSMTEGGSYFSKEFFIEITDSGGDSWPRKPDASPLKSEAREDQHIIEAAIDFIKAEIDRYKPMPD